MKKFQMYLICTIASIAIAFVVASAVHSRQNSLLLKNVEALAESEQHAL